jgi:hypothetical protein
VALLDELLELVEAQADLRNRREVTGLELAIEGFLPEIDALRPPPAATAYGVRRSFR